MLLICSSVATAHDFEVDGICYNITDEADRTVAVTYLGTSYYGYPNKYTDSVVIPSSVICNGINYSVTSIGNNAFHGCSGLNCKFRG